MYTDTTIVAFAHDPGGANAVGATVAALRRAGVAVRLVGAGPALARFARLGLTHEASTGDVEQEMIATADLVLTGTSEYNALEQAALVMAAECGVPSLVISDFWGNQPLRFASRLRGRIREVRPDWVTAIDADNVAELVHAGFRPSQVTITGQPWFGHLVRDSAALVPATSPARSVLIPSQPMAGEAEALDIIAAGVALAGIRRLTVRLHPRAINGEEVIKRLSKSGLTPRIDDAVDIASSAAQHDVVLGMNSAVLIETALAGATVARVRSTAYVFPTALDELITPLDDVDQISAFLRQPQAGSAGAFRIVTAGADERAAAWAIDLLGAAWLRPGSLSWRWRALLDSRGRHPNIALPYRA